MIVPARGPAEATLDDMLSLMRMLLREERSAYDATVAAAVEADGLVNPLAALHHAATFQQHVCKLIELLLGAQEHLGSKGDSSSPTLHCHVSRS